MITDLASEISAIERGELSPRQATTNKALFGHFGESDGDVNQIVIFINAEDAYYDGLDVNDFFPTTGPARLH